MPEPVHRNTARKFLIGVGTLLVAGLVGWIGAMAQTGGELPLKSYTYVKAAFKDVGTLNPREPVTRNGVRIGEVTSVEYDDGRAATTLRLDGEYRVYRDASATVRNSSALGRKFIELNPGNAASGPLAGNTIPVSRTKSSVAIDDVFSVFDPRTRAAARTSVRELGGGLAGHGTDLHDFLQYSGPALNNMGRLSATLSSPATDLRGLLRSANELAGTFKGRQKELSRLLRNLDATLGAVNVDGGRPLGDTLRGLPATLRSAKRGLDALNAPLSDVQGAMTTVQPGADALGQSTADLRGFLREAVTPLRKVPGVSQQAAPALGDLTKTVADARPLVPRVSRAIASADTLLHGLAPYATDISRFFAAHDLLSGRIAPGKHYFSAQLVFPGAYTASLPDPLTKRVPYPEPGGGAWRDNPATAGG